MSLLYRLAVSMFLAMCSLLAAAEYPSKPVRIVVPYAPGGSSDAIARMLAEKAALELRQPVVVENRPGAIEQVAATMVAKSPADGYTILLATQFGLAVNPWLYRKMQYDPAKDFTPVIALARIPNVVLVNPQLPVKTLTELTAYLKANPGKANYGGAGPPLTLELYKRSAGVDLQYIQYKGGALAMQDLIGGAIQVMIAPVSEAMPLVKSGKVRAVAVTASSRLARYPDLMTTTEIPGMQEFESYAWYVLVAPAGTPPEAVKRLNTVLNNALNDASVRDKLVSLDIEPLGGETNRLAAVLAAESAKWRKVIQDAGIKVE